MVGGLFLYGCDHHSSCVRERRMQVATAIKEKSLEVRVSVVRCYVQFCIECEHRSPWILDDALMERFLLIMSLRLHGLAGCECRT